MAERTTNPGELQDGDPNQAALNPVIIAAPDFSRSVTLQNCLRLADTLIVWVQS